MCFFVTAIFLIVAAAVAALWSIFHFMAKGRQRQPKTLDEIMEATLRDRAADIAKNMGRHNALLSRIHEPRRDPP